MSVSRRLELTEIGLDLLFSIFESYMLARLLLKSLIIPVLLFFKVGIGRSFANWFITDTEFDTLVELCFEKGSSPNSECIILEI